MSRIGKKPITIPQGVEVTTRDNAVVVKGPKGTLEKPLRSEVDVLVEGGEVRVTPVRSSNFAQALWGTYASHVKNMITGVTEGYTKRLIVEGVGYRAEASGNQLKLHLGFSHPVIMAIPENITVNVEKSVITITGFNKEEVGQFAANIRSKRPPEPYKGKGIRYEDEVVRRKEGKKTA